MQGGPELPASFHTGRLDSWTTLGDTNAGRFAGSALYAMQFDAPTAVSHFHSAALADVRLQYRSRGGTPGRCYLDLGDVRQSARVRLNGRDYGTLVIPPFRVAVDNLKPSGNLLEVEVTSVSANRIRDLDRRGVPWKVMHDINIVNLDYKPFNAADWPLTPAGLLGPVTLTALTPALK